MNPTAEQLKLEGQEQVWKAERSAWKDAALNELYKYTRFTPEFTAEEFKAWVIPYIGPPHHHNVWGGIFRIGAIRGWIVKAGVRRGNLPRSHAHYLHLWKSIY